MADSNFIVLVQVPDEQSLSELVTAANMRGLRTTINFEPDVDNQATAVVIEPCPEARRLCSSLPLLGREVAMA